MPADYTATGNIAAVRRNGMFGPAGNTFPTNADIVAFLNEEQLNYLVPFVMQPREERFVDIYEFTTTQGLAEYGIPTASLWSDVRDVQVFQTNQWISLARVEPEFAGAFQNSSLNGAASGAYYLQADKIVLNPIPNSPGLVRIKYFRRPGYIVSTGYSTLTAFSGLITNHYNATVTSTAGMVDGDFDLITASVPWPLAISGLAGTVVNGTTLRFEEADVTAAQVAILQAAAPTNDYFMITSGDAPGSQVPQDLIPLLEQRATYRALQAKSDPRASDALKSAEFIEHKILDAMNARTDGLPRKVIGRSFLWGARNGFYGWGPGSGF